MPWRVAGDHIEKSSSSSLLRLGEFFEGELVLWSLLDLDAEGNTPELLDVGLVFYFFYLSMDTLNVEVVLVIAELDP